MDKKFNRYNRYSDDFDHNINEPPVNPNNSAHTFSSDKLRLDYEQREKEFQSRLEERYGYRQRGVASRAASEGKASAYNNRVSNGLAGNDDTAETAAAEKAAAERAAAKKAAAEKAAAEKAAAKKAASERAAAKKVAAERAAAKKAIGRRTSAKGKTLSSGIKGFMRQSGKGSGVLANKKKTVKNNNVKLSAAYRELIANDPELEKIYMARKLKAKKMKRARARKRIAAMLVLVVGIGVLANVVYGKLHTGAFLRENFMVEPVAELDYDKMKSEYVYLYNVDEEREIAGRRIDERMYPASLTKMMTAIVAIEKAGNQKNLNKMVKVPKYLTEKLAGENASVAGFSADEEVSYMDLLYGVMLPSGADACLTIADQMFGSEVSMVQAMNEKADQLNMDGTHFVNTVGLHDENHYSTPRDMAKLLEYGLKNEIFKKIISTEHYTSSVTEQHPQGILMENTVFEKIRTTKEIEEEYGSLLEGDGRYADKNDFYDHSSQYSKDYQYSENTEERYLGDNDLYIKGGKSGYTLEAHLCLATYGEVDGKTYILITGLAYGNPKGEPFNTYDALYAYGQVHKAHVEQEQYINDRIWRRIYVALFG